MKSRRPWWVDVVLVLFTVGVTLLAQHLIDQAVVRSEAELFRIQIEARVEVLEARLERLLEVYFQAVDRAFGRPDHAE